MTKRFRYDFAAAFLAAAALIACAGTAPPDRPQGPNSAGATPTGGNIANAAATATLAAAPAVTAAGAAGTAGTVGTAGAAELAQRPAQILDLMNWKLTLPVNAAGGTTGTPVEIQQPALAAYAQEPYFTVRGDGVQFRAPVNGVTTSGSRYPRAELREMTDDGARLASWSTISGTHAMVVDEAITAVPATKPHVVAGQIHDAKDDVLTIRLEMPRLFVDHNGTAGGTLTPSYVLGARFTVKIEAAGGEIKVYYNGSATPADTLRLDGAGNYFKAGVYTQSNCSRERACAADNYGEVVIYRLAVTHQ